MKSVIPNIYRPYQPESSRDSVRGILSWNDNFYPLLRSYASTAVVDLVLPVINIALKGKSPLGKAEAIVLIVEDIEANLESQLKQELSGIPVSGASVFDTFKLIVASYLEYLLSEDHPERFKELWRRFQRKSTAGPESKVCKAVRKKLGVALKTVGSITGLIDSGWKTAGALMTFSRTSECGTYSLKYRGPAAGNPEFSPSPGEYPGSVNVSISCSTPGAEIYYTKDGTTPSRTNGTRYAAPIRLVDTTTLRAIAFKPGLTASDVREATYTTIESTGTISGSVREAASNDAVSGASVDVFDDTTAVASGTTDGTGLYTIPVPAGSGYRIVVSKPGYLSETYYDVTVASDETTVLEAILQISDEYSGEGDIEGRVVNALDGSGVSGLTVRFRKGISASSGSILASTTTDEYGDYHVGNLSAGSYTGEVSGTGFVTSYFTAVCLGGQTHTGQNAEVTPELDEGETRIVLSWGSSPRDLDSHLTGPAASGEGRFHVYYSDRSYNYSGTNYADLDRDCTNSYGPETITVHQHIDGVYRYSVHDYSNKSSSFSQALAQSNARVKVYQGSRLVATFNVPPSQNGTLWTVFELQGQEIASINALSYESSPSSVYRVIHQTDARLMRVLPEKK